MLDSKEIYDAAVKYVKAFDAVTDSITKGKDASFIERRLRHKQSEALSRLAGAIDSVLRYEQVMGIVKHQE